MTKTAPPGGGGFSYFSVHPQDLESIAGRAAGLGDAIGAISELVVGTLWTAAAATSQPDLQSALIQAANGWRQAIAARSSTVENAAAALRTMSQNYGQVELSVAAEFRRIGGGVSTA